MREPNWTKEEDEQLALLWRKGMHIKQIAFRIGRTPAATKSRRYNLKLPVRSTPPERRRRIQIDLDIETYKLMQQRALERGQGIGNYIKYLIRVNVGTAR